MARCEETISVNPFPWKHSTPQTLQGPEILGGWETGFTRRLGNQNSPTPHQIVLWHYSITQARKICTCLYWDDGCEIFEITNNYTSKVLTQIL